LGSRPLLIGVKHNRSLIAHDLAQHVCPPDIGLRVLRANFQLESPKGLIQTVVLRSHEFVPHQSPTNPLKCRNLGSPWPGSALATNDPSGSLARSRAPPAYPSNPPDS